MRETLQQTVRLVCRATESAAGDLLETEPRAGTIIQCCTWSKVQTLTIPTFFSNLLNPLIHKADTFDNLLVVGPRRGKLGNWGNQETSHEGEPTLHLGPSACRAGGLPESHAKCGFQKPGGGN